MNKTKSKSCKLNITIESAISSQSIQAITAPSLPYPKVCPKRHKSNHLYMLTFSLKPIKRTGRTQLIPCLESANGNSNRLRIAMANADVDLLQSHLSRGLGGFTMQLHDRRAVFVIHDLNVIKRGSGTLAADPK